MIDPREDGNKHINISENGRTPLGRMLSPSFKASFVVPEVGEFDSVENYWLSSSEQGPQENVEIDEKFKRGVLQATWCKVNQNRSIFWRLESNVKDFERYFVLEDGIYVPSDSEWLCEGLEVMSEHIRKNHW